MNKENIELAIKVMKRVSWYEELLGRNLVNMRTYNTSYDCKEIYEYGHPKQETEEEIIKSNCGTTCCLSGWIAASPEFRELGVVPDEDGAAYLPGLMSGDYSVIHTMAKLFDLPVRIMDDLIYDFGLHNASNIVDELKSLLKNCCDENYTS